MKSIFAIRLCALASRVFSIWAILSLTTAATTWAAEPAKATHPYTVSVFATSVPNVYYQPDSITVWNGNVFIGYGNNATPDG